MEIIVFTGPSLAPESANGLFPEAKCLPPAAQGDVYRACKSRPKAICLIDGYFEHRPAVTHKELLWALDQGIAVFGASSMGALRAAEMAPFGMVGRGTIFDLFASGELENDDEVAITHAGADRGFAPASEALVNIRMTLKNAVQHDIVPPDVAAVLVSRAQSLFYAERQYGLLIDEGARANIPALHLTALERWLALPGMRIDQKRRDAEALLCHVRDEWQAERLPRPSPIGGFPYTEAWHELRTAIDELDDQPRSKREEVLAPQALAEEIQLLGPDVFQRILSAATWRAFCLVQGRGGALRGQAPHGAPSLQQLPRNPSLDWLAANDLGAEDYARLVQDEYRVLQANTTARDLVLAQIPNVLRLRGDYAKIAERARSKQALAARDDDAPTEDATDAVHAYFEQRLRRAVPENLDVFAGSVGFSSAEDLVSAICRENAFLRRRVIR